jgi:hypothetical protein
MMKEKIFGACNVLDSLVTEPQISKGVIGKAFKKDAKTIMDYLAVLDANGLAEVEQSLAANG